MERSGTNALGVRRPAQESSITPCRGGRLRPPCMTAAPCRAGPACPAAGYSVRPNSAKRCHSEPVRAAKQVPLGYTLAWESVSPRLPLRGRCQREALTEGEMPCVFLSPSRLRRQPPPRGGCRCSRADGTSGRRDTVPYGWITHLPRRAGAACPAEKCVPGGGTHGSLPTGAYPQKNNAAPRMGRRAFSVRVWHRRRRVIFAAWLEREPRGKITRLQR